MWEQHERYLYAHCCALMKNEPEAREALSDAMLKVYESSRLRLDHIGNIRSWFTKIVHNHCLDILRQNKRLSRTHHDPDQVLQHLEAELGGYEMSPEVELVQEEKYARILSAVDDLPERLRQVMVLLAYQGLSYKEIGLQLDISQENARKRVQQAREILRERLNAHPDDARAHRRPDPIARPQREERRAADGGREPDREMPGGREPNRYAVPVQVRLEDGRAIEIRTYAQRKKGRIAQRVPRLEKYIQAHPGGWVKRLEYAQVLSALGRWPEAVAQYHKVLDRRPQRADLRIRAAEMCCLLQQPTEAAALLEAPQPAGLPPGMAAHMAAVAATCRGKLRRAAAQWQAALQAEPETAVIRLGYVRHLLRTGSFAQAIDLLRGHIRQHPMDREAFGLLADAYRLAGQSEDWGALIEEIFRRFPRDVCAIADYCLLWLNAREGTDADLRPIVKLCRKVRRMAPGTALAINLELRLHELRGTAPNVLETLRREAAITSPVLQVVEAAAASLERIQHPRVHSCRQRLQTEFADLRRFCAESLNTSIYRYGEKSQPG